MFNINQELVKKVGKLTGIGIVSVGGTVLGSVGTKALSNEIENIMDKKNSEKKVSKKNQK